MLSHARRARLQRPFLLAVSAISAALLPSAASAHTGHAGTHDFATGFLHPVTGLDHLLAMLAVGLLAAHLGGLARWLLPLSFLVMMSVGGLIASMGLMPSLAETGIALSLVVFGVMLFSDASVPRSLAAAIAGAFAVFHGFAHGVEMPAAASGVVYGLGFLAMTGLLHAVGLVAGVLMSGIEERSRLRVQRLCGGGLATFGLVLASGGL